MRMPATLQRKILSAGLTVTLAVLASGMVGVSAQVPHIEKPGADPLMTTTDQVVAVGQTTLAATYGGAKIDRSAGVVDVLLTDITASAVRVLHAGVTHPELLRISQARYTMVQLMALRDRIFGDRAALASQGVHVWGVGISFGNVVASISDAARTAEALLKERYGDAVTVVVGPQPTHISGPTQTRLGPPPYMGGMEIDDIGNYQTVSTGFYYECTAGFIARSQSTFQGIALYYIITAGHCFNAASGEVIYHAVATSQTDEPVGRVAINSFYEGGNSDSESIGIQAGYVAATNQIITAEPYVHTIDYLADTQESIDGQAVCKSGMTTDQTCNFTVQAIHQEVTSVDSSTGVQTTLYDQVQACCDALDHGDSGGPVYHYYQPQAIYGVGLVADGNSVGQMTFSFIQDAEADLGVWICTQPPQYFGC